MQDDLPRLHEAKLWTTDAPRGKAWTCPDCGHWATLGGNAAYHAMKMKHAPPELLELPPGTKTLDPTWVQRRTNVLGLDDEPEPVTEEPPVEEPVADSASMVMQLGDSLRLALTVADTALDMLEQRGQSRQVLALRDLVLRIRRGE